MNKLLFVLIISFPAYLVAQPTGFGGGQGAPSQITGKVQGVLVDSQTGDPVSFATIAIKKPGSNTPINGMVTGDDGIFKIVGLPLGELDVQISFIGYQTITKTVELTKGEPDVDMGSVQLISDAAELDEVVISGDREIVESKIDRIVYNAEQDIANMGGDATDVLRRAPLLSVDLEGNVSLRGSQNVQIMINGKPSGMFATNPADALKVIPADNIKSVEVITAPGAKYDGEGTSGIINIITKKQTPQGFSGNVDASVGTRSNRGVLNINAGRGRFGMNASGSTYFNWPQTGYSNLYSERTFGNVTTIQTEEGENISQRTGFFTNASAYYDVNAYNSFTSSFRLRGFNSNTDGEYFNELIESGYTETFTRITDNRSLRSGYEWTMDYIKKFAGQEGREFSVSIRQDSDINDTRSSTQREEEQVITQDFINQNDGTNRENTLQVDYIHPFGESKIELGAKAVLRDLRSITDFDTLAAGGIYVNDPLRSNDFSYEQDVWAGYASLTTKFLKTFGLVAGVRYEATDISGDVVSDADNDFENFYGNVLPSVILSYNIGRVNTLKASYNRRIQRPSLRFINPFVEQDNNRNISFGNPLLAPEITDNYDLSFSTFKSGTAINVSVYYRNTTDVIQSIVSAEALPGDSTGTRTVTTFQNIDQQSATGTDLFVSKTLFDIWTLRGGVNLSWFQSSGRVGEVQLTNRSLLGSGNFGSQLKLPGDITVDAFGFFRSPQQTVQGTNTSFYIWGIGARKELWDGQGSIGLRFIEPFVRYKRFFNEVESPALVLNSEIGIPFQSYGFSFSYKFGKLDFTTRQRRSRINNNDQLNGDDGSSQF